MNRKGLMIDNSRSGIVRSVSCTISLKRYKQEIQIFLNVTTIAAIELNVPKKCLTLLTFFLLITTRRFFVYPHYAPSFRRIEVTSIVEKADRCSQKQDFYNKFNSGLSEKSVGLLTRSRVQIFRKILCSFIYFHFYTFCKSRIVRSLYIKVAFIDPYCHKFQIKKH